MEIETGIKQIRALNVYSKVAEKEYDDSHKYYDTVDNKVNIFVAISVAVPTLLLSWAKIHAGINVSFILDCFGFASLIGVFVFIFLALRVRKAKFGAHYNELQEACRNYDDETMRESIADMWLESADKNNTLAEEKAGQLKYLQWLFLSEMLFFILATICTFCAL